MAKIKKYVNNHSSLRVPLFLTVHGNPAFDCLAKLSKAVLIKLIAFYRYAISALLGHCCRFEPTCSCYAIQAIEVHGCVKGCRLALKRILRCHPWQPGGFDPLLK